MDCEENATHNTRTNTEEIKRIIDEIIINIYQIDLINDMLYGVK